MFWSQQIRIYTAEKKEMYQRSILSLLFLLTAWGAQAQQISFSQQEARPYYKRYLLQAGDVKDHSRQTARLLPEGTFTAVAFSLPDREAFSGLYCVVNGDSLAVRPAVHQREDAAEVVSELLVFDVPQSEILLSASVPEEGIRLHFINTAAATTQHDKKTPFNERQRGLASPCDEPQVVSQSVWRKGLPAPDYSRSFNKVEHLIVHHSATGNQLTDYTNVVRNIYLYHTEVNGWSDIGYNYLIAPDGTIFAGRDPEGSAQDNVRGAHFCGQNSGTMGVCLLGDYTQAQPEAEALLGLEHLLSWKTNKEQLEATEEKTHAANPQLPVIAGHQDGCATACPGRYVYEKLPALRLAVQENQQACEKRSPQPWVYFAPRTQEVCLGGLPEEELDGLQVYDIQGRAVAGAIIRLQSQDICFKAVGLVPGVYFLQAERGRMLIRRKFMIF